MANLSDGEDSQMHDSPSSTPSTPPALQSQNPLINPAEHLSLHSPPDTQQTPPASQQGTPLILKSADEGRMASQAGVGQGGFVPSWASKRAIEDAETAREKLVDGKFSLRWVGDDYDESDMFKTN